MTISSYKLQEAVEGDSPEEKKMFAVGFSRLFTAVTIIGQFIGRGQKFVILPADENGQPLNYTKK